MSNSNELFTLLYSILDKLDQIQSHLGIEEIPAKQDTPKFSVVKEETVIKFPTLE